MPRSAWVNPSRPAPRPLRTALSSRSVIDQAIGIIIGMQRCPAETGFDVLRTVSQNRNIPLRAIAADLVARTINPEPSN